MRTVLTALFLCLAFLFGMLPEASGKAITGPENSYPEQKLVKIGEVTGEFESVGRIPHREITIWFYDPATGVVFYVNQNPWSKFDPEGLYLDLIVEVASIGAGVTSAVSNFRSGNYGEAWGDVGFAALDTVLAVVPGVPGGTGLVRQGVKQGIKHGDDIIDGVRAVDKTTDTASTLTKTARETTEQSKKQVSALDVDSKSALDKRAVVGDGLQGHEIPSKAAIEKATEQKLQRSLSAKEKAALQSDNTAVAIPDAVHRDLPTTGGRNRSRSSEDAKDLRAAERRDLRDLADRAEEAGMNRDDIARSVRNVRKRNRDRGL